jgi:NADPH2:quinone reductase
MIYGTAGFTAALCLERMLHNGQTPEMGPILVTGASGGVGQFAVSFFCHAGFEVHAVTGKHALAARLEKLGAKKVVFTSQLELGQRPLESTRYGGIVDNVGGKTLAGLISQVQLWGNVACVGLAESAELHTTVLPMILRGVTLLGISANNTPWPLRQKIWSRLAGDLKPDNLESFVTQTVQLKDLLVAAQDMLARKTHGRTIVQHI